MNARVAAAVFSLALGATACSQSPPPSHSLDAKPSSLDLEPLPLDLVVLNVELLRADHVGLISGERDVTPNIDRFFAGGIVFTDATAPAGATYLSATAIATGTEAMLNDHRLTYLGLAINEVVARDGKRLVDHLPTIAENLRESGYWTAALNEWQHTGKDVLLDRGFEEFIQIEAPPRAKDPRPEDITLFDDQVDQLLALLDRCRGRRFYLYWHPNALHYPFCLPIERARRDAALYAELEALADVHERFVSVHPQRMRDRAESRPAARAREPVAADQEERVQSLTRRMYREQLRYVDDELGRFFAELERGGDLERTLVVLYSNHGIGLFDNDVGIMGVPYQSCVHVPLLIRHPRSSGPVHVATPVSMVDLATTLYELLGVTPELSIPAHSLLPPVRGLPYGRQSIVGRDIQTEFIRRGEWKLIVNTADSRELYDLTRDPGEVDNVYDADLEIVRILEADLRREKLAQHRLRSELSQRLGVDEAWPDDAAAP